MRKSKTKEEADRDLTYMEEKMRRELREKIHEFGVDCSRRFCILGYSWIDEILIYFLDLKIRLETKFIIRNELSKIRKGMPQKKEVIKNEGKKRKEVAESKFNKGGNNE